MQTGHIPVLLAETISALSVKPGGRYIDGTFGRGGHSREIARRGGTVLGIDRDPAAVAAAGGINVVLGLHGDMEKIARERGWEFVDGVLLDLGVSSPQLDEADRGFSFMREGPLDMRMGRSGGVTAADVVNGWDADELERIFRDFGEEPQSRRVARAIVSRRESKGPFDTTASLADFISSLKGRRGARHPATRVFQALRMAVNDEVGELERALAAGMRLLAPGGRFAVISFESVTDRIVKRFFAAHVGRMVSLQGGGCDWSGEPPRAVEVMRGAVKPGEAESAANPRARSAKLRAIEKV